jgi:hypothetical protein
MTQFEKLLHLPCIDLSKLIKVKAAAGRPKDFEAVSELKAIQEERKRFRGDRE